MKSEKKILLAFLLNLFFSVFELVGGLWTGSIAILSDSLHDFGDALGIGISWGLEKRSERAPDKTYTFGYARDSLLGSVITTALLMAGSVFVLIQSVRRIVTPTPIQYDGMILLGVVGVLVNGAATFFTREGDSLNQKAVNLHLLEDVLGWVVVLVGAVVMRFTDFSVLDPILSLGVSAFISVSAFRNLAEVTDVFLEKIPREIDLDEVEAHLLSVDGVVGVHHLHIWSLDGQNHYATVHVVSDSDPHEIKEAVRNEMREHGIGHVTVELERINEECREENCRPQTRTVDSHHHHH